jgi:hypothetical protein
MPVSELNELRRAVVMALEAAIIEEYNATLPPVKEKKWDGNTVMTIPKKNFYLIADVKDLQNMNLNGFDLILCPTDYTVDSIGSLITALTAKGINLSTLYLNLPVVATEAEISILDTILATQKIGIVANNYAHLRWVKQYKTIAGIGLNVYNNETAQVLLNLGCENVIWSIEKHPSNNGGSALVSGYPALMTLCHCPIRTVYGADCNNCRYHSNLIYQDEKHNRYQFRRFKIKHCYFELLSTEKYQRVTQTGKIYDLRRF